MVFSLAVEGAGGQADVHDTHQDDAEDDGTGKLLEKVLKHVLTLIHNMIPLYTFMKLSTQAYSSYSAMS